MKKLFPYSYMLIMIAHAGATLAMRGKNPVLASEQQHGKAVSAPNAARTNKEAAHTELRYNLPHDGVRRLRHGRPANYRVPEQHLLARLDYVKRQRQHGRNLREDREGPSKASRAAQGPYCSGQRARGKCLAEGRRSNLAVHAREGSYKVLVPEPVERCSPR